jgi:hypothetical protein
VVDAAAGSADVVAAAAREAAHGRRRAGARAKPIYF